MEALGAPAQGLGERGGADRHEHELLEVERVVGVRPAVEHVHHRRRAARARSARRGSGRAAGRRSSAAAFATASDTPSIAFAPRRALVGGAVEVDQRRSTPRWSKASSPVDRVARSRPFTFATAARTPLPPDLRVLVAELERLVLAGGRAAGHGGSAERAVVQRDVDLDGGVATGVEDHAGVDLVDAGHPGPMLPDA